MMSAVAAEYRVTPPIIVTGSRGFTGRHLVEILRGEGIPVVGVDRTPTEHGDDVQVDLQKSETVRELFRDVRPGRIYHLAGIVREPVDEAGRRDLLDANLGSTMSVLEASMGLPGPVRVLVTSSCAVYGVPERADGRVAESDPIAPVLFYGVTKASQELLAASYQRRGGPDVLITRAFNVTGPGESDAFLIGTVAHQMGTGGAAIRLGNLDRERDFLDVRDAVSAYRVVMDRGQPGMAYNVGSGRPIVLRDLVSLVMQVAGLEREVIFDVSKIRSIDVPRIHADVTRLAGLGWTPCRDLATTVRDTLEHGRHIEGCST